ncbi:arginine N-methyltransferase-like protein [Phyllosticta paracitricarpa]|uniref:Arginine N-methyltransferase 2 n=1 Tax=Phyllosticta paracitricarpa TaxID=2016321 RepID=A0ABR1N5H8_9PEZI
MSTDLSAAAADLGIELPREGVAAAVVAERGTVPTTTAAVDDETLATQSLLLASSHHDVAALRDMLRTTPANVADPETGLTPLHAALLAFEDEDANEANEQPQPDKAELDKAAETVKLLLAHGAVWNDLDGRGETPGCVAARLGLTECYGLIVDAGVRAELLLARLDEYQVLSGGGDEESEDEEMSNGDAAELEASGVVVQQNGDEVENKDVKSDAYLASDLTFTADRLLDADHNGVMMAWETSLMRRSAELLAPKAGLRVLNVGHGMGIVDGIFQEKQPAAHHIIEAHPAVVQRMREQGWDKKPGVVIHEGRWQDVVPKLVEQNGTFDAIYFDTFAEEYSALREFFSEYVIGLLEPEGRFGFFNGLGADRKVCYDVYTKIVEMDLFEAGFDTEWEEIPIPDLDANGEWEGVRRKYWVLDTYRLPTCKFIA